MRKLLFFLSLGVLIVFSASTFVFAEEDAAIATEKTKSDLIQEEVLDQDADSLAGQMQKPKEESEELKDVGDIVSEVDFAAKEEVFKDQEVAEKASEIIQQ